MITDAEFWIEVRRRQGGRDDMFKLMLALIHAHQSRIYSCVGTLDQEEYRIISYGKKRLDSLKGAVLTPEEEKHAKELQRRQEWRLTEMGKDKKPSEALRLKGTPPRRVATITIRVLQQIMLYAVPIYDLRYTIPAMSMSWSNSCIIERSLKQLITFGAGQGVQVSESIQGRGCIAGDGFFAILSNRNEVWASGGLKVSRSSSSGPTPLGRENAMIGIATKVVMLVGHGQRLACLTRAFTVRPLSEICVPTRSIIPSRHIRFLDLGYGDDYYMVGMDSVLYKTTASKHAISTPRRVMSLSHKLISKISSGMSFLLIIDQNGRLYTTGRNRSGQLGCGSKQDTRRKPYLVDSLTHHFFTQVAAGEWHSLALSSSGIVYGAGSNENGQLGMGADVKEVLHFRPVPLPGKCLGIAAGPAGSMFACEGGLILTCGLNDCMQLGLDTADKIVYNPTPISTIYGVETYTMDFGGFSQPKQTLATVIAKEHVGEEENGFPPDNVASCLQPINQVRQSPVNKSIATEGKIANLDLINGSLSNSSIKPVKRGYSRLNSTGSATEANMSKFRNGQPEPHRVDNTEGGKIVFRPNCASREPNSVSEAKAQRLDARSSTRTTDSKGFHSTNTQTPKTSNQKCTKCCRIM